MASIQTAIQLNDMISAPLMHISNALNMTVSSFEEMQATANSAFNSSHFDSVRMEINNANMAMDEMVQNIQNNESAQENFNRKVRDGTSAAGNLEKKLLGMVATYASMQTAGKVLNLSDQMTQTTARLNMMNDGLQTTKDLQNMIFLSAERARGVYQSTADSVSKLGLMAGNAFSSSDEIIGFMEQINKQFVIAGTETSGIQAAMLQLTQAMGSGVLRGEEYNSILEQAPNIIQNIAKYIQSNDDLVNKMAKGIGVKADILSSNVQGHLKDIAAEGLISASIVKAAMFAAADETNAKFESMPMTFGQVATSIKNNAMMAFQPMLDRLNEIANSESFNNMADGIIDTLVFTSGVVLEIFDLIGQAGMFIADNWSIIEPIVLGVAAALGVYTGYLAITNGLELISMAGKSIMAVWEGIHAAAIWATTGATWAQVLAQQGLNDAMYACPIVWIIILIIGLIAAFYAVIAAINKFSDTSISATGIISGAFAWLGAFLYDLFLGLLELVIGVIQYMINPFVVFANFIGNLFVDPLSAVIYLFQGMADTVLALLEKIASAMDFVFGSNMADAVAGWRSGLKEMADEAVRARGYNPADFKTDILDFGIEDFGLKRLDLTNAYDAGYKWGQGIEEKVSNFDLSSVFGSNIPDPSSYGANDFGSVPANIGKIAEDTGKMKDSVDITAEELKYMRDIADRDAINKFTTAEIKVDMPVNASISNNMDLDGVISYLGDGINDAMERVAEGVHDS